MIVGGRTDFDDVCDDLAGTTRHSARPGKVASQEGTAPKSMTVEERKAKGYINADSGTPLPPDVDGLFGATKAYIRYQKEQPAHRLMLWYKLQGFDNREVAKLTGYSYHSVNQIVKQEWFQTAFCQLAEEMGKDRINSFLEGEIMPALVRTAELAKTSESEAIRLAANKEILDRYLGKSTVKVESKTSIDITNTTLDANRLLEEQRRLDEQLRSNGLLHGNS